MRYQSPITGLFPVLSTDTEIGSVRDSVYCAAAVWGLYQSYRYVKTSIVMCFHQSVHEKVVSKYV